jgi:hypothetical protein
MKTFFNICAINCNIMLWLMVAKTYPPQGTLTDWVLAISIFGTLYLYICAAIQKS